ncbi:response regulator [Pseudobacillus sp. FSL P4-0506]|uniref:response regulator n=1 Tax=unclassified Pseudobacillus TaxID=2619284 RepID=UPI0030F7E34B
MNPKQEHGWEQIAQLVIDHVIDGIITINRQGLIESFNPAAEKIFGYSSGEIIGKTVNTLMPEPYKSQHDTYIDNYMETGDAKIIGIGREVTGKRKDGTTFPMDLAVTQFFIEEDMHFVGIVKDITERKKTEAALEKALRDNFEHTVKNLQNLIFKLKKDRNRKIVYTLMAGQNAQEIGLTTMNTLNKTPSDIFPKHVAMELESYHERAFQGENVNYEWSFAGKVFYISLSPIFESNFVIEVVGSGIDITDRKKMEEALALARDHALEASKLKSQFLANMSHEIRTPMNGIIGMVDVLMDTPLNHKQREYISIIRDSSQALLTIINDILDYSKMEAGKMTIEHVSFTPTSLVEGIAEILLPKARHKEISLLTYIDPSIPNVLIGDPGRLRQVLLNLSDNAVKFTEKGNVLIRAILKEVKDGKAVIHFAIIDTGIGLSDEEQDGLFQPFVQSDGSTTRKFGGTGLGLAISKRLVELMDGEIGVESEKENGSTFWFNLPFSIEESSKQMEQRMVDMPLEHLRLLIVDDHPEECEILQKYVSSWGMMNKSVDNGIDALAELQREAVNGQPYHLVIVHLENLGMNPATFIQIVKQTPYLSKLHLILINDFNEQNNDLIVSEYDACLSKPVKQSQLFDCIVSLAHPLPKKGTNEERKTNSMTGQHERINRNHPILLVEDNPMNRKVALFQLEKLGYTADVVTNGQEAVKKITTHDYALILMDIQMPIMDGIEATKAIRNSPSSEKRIPIVAMTANAMKSDREKYLKAGMDDYLSKPVKLEKLREVLEHWMPKSESSLPETKVDVLSKGQESAPIAIHQLEKSYGDSSMVKELLEMFLSATPDLMERLHQSIVKRSEDLAVKTAHNLKGSAAIIYAEQFTQLSKDIEQAAKAENWDTALSTYKQLVQHFRHLQNFIQQLKY